ncbi:MAG: hypothetical protein NBV76_05390 [Candidatus Ochrobactrum gambitense]|nr:MAG: hypothetical protein NBV76_05390 [Candidatus Ochrobactrum gambitense]WEK17194.1 MAG: hypothetical protein P0Y54_05570 [Candidatus Ochrobactrum gambitense]
MASKSMTIQEMQNVCNELQSSLSAKGKNRTAVRFWIESHAAYWIALEWQKGISGWESESEYLRGDNLTKLIASARKFIADMPDPEVAKFKEFMGALGNVIELGRKNGIEVEFINPLTETMKRLSKNALTDQRVAS